MCIPLPDELRGAPLRERMAYRRGVRQDRRAARWGAPAGPLTEAQDDVADTADNSADEQQQARELIIRQALRRRGFGMALGAGPLGAASVGVRTLSGGS